jgi:hypothetical protein
MHRAGVAGATGDGAAVPAVYPATTAGTDEPSDSAGSSIRSHTMSTRGFVAFAAVTEPVGSPPTALIAYGYPDASTAACRSRMPACAPIVHVVLVAVTVVVDVPGRTPERHANGREDDAPELNTDSASRACRAEYRGEPETASTG